MKDIIRRHVLGEGGGANVPPVFPLPNDNLIDQPRGLVVSLSDY